MRDRIEAVLLDLNPNEIGGCTFSIYNEHSRHVLAGVLRKAFAPQLAIAHADAETLDRVRKLVRKHRYDDMIPKRALEAALYGEEGWKP